MRRVLDFIDALLSRAGAWPVIVTTAVIFAGYVTGLLGQVWSFPLWLQLAIFSAFALLAVWVVAKLLGLVFKPSTREVQDRIFALWRQGDEFVQSGTVGSSDWGTWRAAVFTAYAHFAPANDRIWLTRAFAPNEDGSKLAMDGLRTLADHLDTEARSIRHK